MISTVFRCDSCKNVIEKGFCFIGNVNIVEGDNDEGGLIGDAFPRHKKKFSFLEIERRHLCRECTLTALQIEIKQQR